ncbi:hypothetical protein BLA29_008525 [Euroglyphus maynei]|uniref:ABC-2 type transporter transmembrane domain-containing protein n=1 Tax=Euroglyphus maynei TaxID=6958 RepID=A0A1Y3B5S1_EURMA|nr:hypothetical protein BLA29_008525 [Euroglyphus maynei]
MNGALFLLLVNMTMQNAFAVINVFCSELPIFIREHNNGMYTVDAYFLCKNLAEIPIFVCIPIIFVTIYYYTLNLYPSFDSYLYCMLIAVIISSCGVSFGYLISCLCRNTDVALSFGPPLIMPFQLLGGFFLNTHSIPSFLRWTKWISWFYYGFDALAVNQWRNVAILDCTEIPSSSTNDSSIINDTQQLRSQQMCFENGHDVLRFLSLGIQPEWLDFFGILSLMLLLRFVAYLTLLFIARKR